MALTATRPIAPVGPATCSPAADRVTPPRRQADPAGWSHRSWCGKPASARPADGGLGAPSQAGCKSHEGGPSALGGDVFLRLWVGGIAFDYVVSAAAVGNLLDDWARSRWCTIEVVGNPSAGHRPPRLPCERLFLGP